MDPHWTLLLLQCVCLLLCFPWAHSITWTSSTSLPDRKHVTGCRGHDLDLLWGFKVEPGETYINMEWYFSHVPGRRGQIIAYKVGENFNPASYSGVTVQEANSSAWNGGIVLPLVSPQNNGQYTIKVFVDSSSTISVGETQTVTVHVEDTPVLGPTGFHAEIVAGSVEETASGDMRLELSCGTLSHVGQPPLTVMWKTPNSGEVNSTRQEGGVYYLLVEEANPDGNYSCFVPPTSPGLPCIQANSSLLTPQLVTVREADLRSKLMTSQLTSVAEQNANLTSLVQGLMAQVTSVLQANAGLVSEVQQLKEQQARLLGDRVNVTAKMDNLTHELQTLQTENGDLQHMNSELTAQLQRLNSSLLPQSSQMRDYVALPQNCQDVRHYDNTDGQHTLFTRGRMYHAYCDQTTDGGGWTVIQRRMDGSVEFYRDWRDYENGFGDVNGDYWLGLEKLYWLTSSNTYKLRVQLTHFDGSQATALYSAFSVSDAANQYALRVSGYSGNAGDSLRLNSGRGFTTFDRDNDLSSGNCARADHGGFWYGDCTNVNINGRYYRTAGDAAVAGDDGMYWYDWKSNTNSLKTVVMMVKAV